MDIKFKNIHIENFMSIGEIDLDFVDKGFTLIEGVNNNSTDNARSNGSGKSSIFEALVWALTGNTVRGNKDVVNYNREGGTLVTIKMIVDNSTFNVTRTKEHSKYKTNLFIEINGVDKSGKGIRDSEKLLSEYLPDLTPSLIGSVIVLGQGLPQKFSNNSPSGRKEVLEKLFKSDYMIQDLKDRISKRRTELNDEIRKVQDNKLVNLTKINTLTDRINLDNVRVQELINMDDLSVLEDILHKDILDLEEKSVVIKNAIDDYTAQKNQNQEKISTLKIGRAETIANIDAEYAELLNETQTKVNDSLVKVTYTKVEFDKAKNVTDVCPTCGQKLPEVHKPDLTKFEENYLNAQKVNNELNSELNRIKSEIAIKKQTITEQMSSDIDLCERVNKSLTDKLRDLSTEQMVVINTLNSKKDELQQNLSLQQNISFEINSLSKSIEENQKTIDTLTEANKSLEDQENILNERLGIQSKFNTVITRDFRGYLLNDIISYIDKKAKDYCNLVFDTELIDFKLDGNNLLISYSGKEYESLSGGERQKVDLIIQFAIRDMLCIHTSFSSNIIVLDEIFDNLDDIGCQKILDLITTRLYDIDSVFIITHHGNELNIPYDTVIKIQKDNDGVTKVI